MVKLWPHSKALHKYIGIAKKNVNVQNTEKLYSTLVFVYKGVDCWIRHYNNFFLFKNDNHEECET